jgi:hypothetical protein
MLCSGLSRGLLSDRDTARKIAAENQPTQEKLRVEHREDTANPDFEPLSPVTN